MIANIIKMWNEQKIDFLRNLSILLYFIVLFNADLKNSGLLWWSSFGILMIFFALHIRTNKFTFNTITKKYMLWSIIFICFNILSMLWAINIGYSIEVIKKLIVRSVALWFISAISTEKNNFFMVMKMFVMASIINSLYILWKIDLTTLGNVRIGVGSLGQGWNANTIGLTMAFSTFVLFFLYIHQQNAKKRWLYLCIFIFLGAIILFTGSRKALLILIFAPLFFLYMNSENKIKAGLIILFSGIILLYLVMNVPIFHSIIGARIESLLSYFTGEGQSDGSTRERMRLIKLGFLWLKEKPILGYGANNFIKLFGDTTGRYIYSHNNFIELLVNTGIIGFGIYYSMYIAIIKNTFRKKDLYSIFAFVTIITLLISETGLVSYYGIHAQLLICLSFSAISIAKQEELENE
jgi:O-antigen ligase